MSMFHCATHCANLKRIFSDLRKSISGLKCVEIFILAVPINPSLVFFNKNKNKHWFHCALFDRISEIGKQKNSFQDFYLFLHWVDHSWTLHAVKPLTLSRKWAIFDNEAPLTLNKDIIQPSLFNLKMESVYLKLLVLNWCKKRSMKNIFEVPPSGIFFLAS